MGLDEARESRRKLCEGMDALTLEEKERCLSFAEAINAIEGLTISTELKQQLEKWKNGETTFYQVFEDTLKRYGFPIQDQKMIRSKQRKRDLKRHA